MEGVFLNKQEVQVVNTLIARANVQVSELNAILPVLTKLSKVENIEIVEKKKKE